MTWPTKTDFVDGNVLTAAQVNNIGTNLNEADPTGITDGYVLTADGAGSMGWEAVSAEAYTQLATGTLSGSSVTVSSLPSGYKRLEVWIYNMTQSTSYAPFIRFQPTGTIVNAYFTYQNKGSWSQGTGGLGAISTVNAMKAASTVGAMMWAACHNYTATSGYKTAQGWAQYYDSANQYCMFQTMTTMDGTAAMNEVFIGTGSGSGNWTGGTYYIYGVN
jgi:hypothetical protein